MNDEEIMKEMIMLGLAQPREEGSVVGHPEWKVNPAIRAFYGTLWAVRQSILFNLIAREIKENGVVIDGVRWAKISHFRGLKKLLNGLYGFMHASRLLKKFRDDGFLMIELKDNHPYQKVNYYALGPNAPKD